MLLGIEEGDGEADMRYLADKVAGLRVFEDANEKMNLSVRMSAARYWRSRSSRSWVTRSTGGDWHRGRPA